MRLLPNSAITDQAELSDEDANGLLGYPPTRLRRLVHRAVAPRHVGYGSPFRLIPFPSQCNYLGVQALPVTASTRSVGEPRRAVTSFRIDKTSWTAAALSQDLAVGVIPPRTRVVGVVADTTEGYSGVANPRLRLGTTTDSESLLLGHSVASQTTKGLADGELGTPMCRAGSIQGGYLPSWTAASTLYARLVADTNLGDGTSTNLTAGATTFHLVTESLPES